MSDETNESSVREQRVNEVIAAHLEAMDAGEAPDPKEFIAAHSDVAVELESFFANRDEFERMAEPLQPAGAAAPETQHDDVTLPPAGEPTEAPTFGPTETADAAIGTMVRYFGDYELLEEKRAKCPKCSAARSWRGNNESDLSKPQVVLAIDLEVNVEGETP